MWCLFSCVWLENTFWDVLCCVLLPHNCQISLAYLTATTHGLQEDASRLRELLEAQGMPVPEVKAENDNW